MFYLCFIKSPRYSYKIFVLFLFLFQSNCYSRVITVDGQKKIIIFASRRYQNLSFCFLSSYKFRLFPLKLARSQEQANRGTCLSHFVRCCFIVIVNTLSTWEENSAMDRFSVISFSWALLQSSVFFWLRPCKDDRLLARLFASYVC